MASLAKIYVSKLSITLLHGDVKVRSSVCWKYFGHIVLTEGNKKKILDPDKVYCMACLNSVKAETDDVTFGSVKIKSYSKSVSTGNLTRHLRQYHKIKDEPKVKEEVKVKEEPVSEKKAKRLAKTLIKDILGEAKRAGKKKTIDSQASGSTEAPKHDALVMARDMAIWYCRSLIPFGCISDEGMAEFFKKYDVISDETDLPTRSVMIGSALYNVHQCMQEIVNEKIFSNTSRHCAITFDSWTDQHRDINYITFVLHYLTAEFELKSLTLSTRNVTGKETWERIHDAFKDLKEEFGLDAKYIHAVTDAGNALERAVSLESMEHHLCLGHGLHSLVTVDGIDSVPEVKDLITKCKKVVNALQHQLSDEKIENDKVLMNFFDAVARAVETLEIDESDPISQNIDEFAEIDIPTTNTPTRWHVILEMLNSLIGVCNRDIVNDMLRKIGQDHLCFNQNEWILMNEVFKFLELFSEAVEIMSSQKTCTMNVALVFRSEIIDVLKSFSSDESSILTLLKQNMLASINNRFPVTKTVAAAALLDKRFMGLQELDLYLDSRNMTKAAFLASYVKDLIKPDDLSENLESNDGRFSVSAKTGSSSSILSKLSRKHSARAGQGIEDDPIDRECWRYLASAAVSTDLYYEDVLSYWKEKKKDFPWLSAFARALLCVPATSIPSERVFSVEGLELSIKRSRLSPQRLNKIMFIHDNYMECRDVL